MAQLKLEYCWECGEPTGKAGRGDGSIYINYPDKEVGPLCNECRNNHWECEECGEGVYSHNVTYECRHEGCGGLCV